MADTSADELRCSFCGKAQSEVAHIVCGPTPDIAICNECVTLSTEIMREESGEPPPAPGDQASPSQ